MLSELIPELFPENHQPPGVDDRCHRPDVCDCCHEPPRAGVLLYAGYERDYQWLCLWCWARNMRFLRVGMDEAGRELTLKIAQADAANDQPRVDALLREKDRLNRGRA